jgi:hypothetical protein
MTHCYHLTSRLFRRSDRSLDAVRGDDGSKMEKSVSEVNLVHGHLILFHPRPVLQWTAYLPFGPATSSPIPARVPSVWFVSLSFSLSNSGVLIDKITRSLPPLFLFSFATAIDEGMTSINQPRCLNPGINVFKLTVTSWSQRQHRKPQLRPLETTANISNATPTSRTQRQCLETN